MGRRGPPIAEVSAKSVAVSALDAEAWTASASVLDAVEAAGYSRAMAHTTLYKLRKEGRIERRGAHNQCMEYRLASTSSDVTAQCETVTPALSPDSNGLADAQASEAYSDTTNPPPASLGLVCGAKPPENPSQGRIEDALADAMPLQKPQHLSHVLRALPEGWSRAEAVSALTDGVLEGWISSLGNGAERWFLRLDKPPPPRTDALAERFKAMRLRACLEDIDRGLADLLKEAGLPENGDVVAAIRSARANTTFALKRIDV